MVLHGPHQSAQKSVTTMREELRVWAKWAGEVMWRILDIVAIVVEVVRGSEVRVGFGGGGVGDFSDQCFGGGVACAMTTWGGSCLASLVCLVEHLRITQSASTSPRSLTSSTNSSMTL